MLFPVSVCFECAGLLCFRLRCFVFVFLILRYDCFVGLFWWFGFWNLRLFMAFLVCSLIVCVLYNIAFQFMC